MNKLEFFLSFEPPTATAQQRKHRIAKIKGKQMVMTYKPQPVKDAEELFRIHLASFCPNEPIEGPIRVSCDWIFPWRKSEKKSVMREFSAIPKTTKPDSGNSNKLLIDCMTKAGFWNDDAQVFDESARKYWGDEPGILVSIEWGHELGFVRKGGMHEN